MFSEFEDAFIEVKDGKIFSDDCIILIKEENFGHYRSWLEHTFINADGYEIESESFWLVIFHFK